MRRAGLYTIYKCVPTHAMPSLDGIAGGLPDRRYIMGPKVEDDADDEDPAKERNRHRGTRDWWKYRPSD
jgi:hypothetical protein